MAYWCDDRALLIEQRRLDAAQEDARRKLNDMGRKAESDSTGGDATAAATTSKIPRGEMVMATANGLLRDIAATLETVIDRVDQVHDTNEALPEDVEAALNALIAASALLRRYR